MANAAAAAASGSDFRKVELDSLDDLRYLYNNLLENAREKIELHLPKSAALGSAAGAGSGVGGGTDEESGEDPLRKRVEEMIVEYVNRTFNLALHSISINGLDQTTPSTSHSNPLPTSSTTTVSSTRQPLSKAQPDITALLTPPTPAPVYEPYDRALHTRVQDLYTAIDAYHLKVASLRREAPPRAVKRWEKALEREMTADEELLERIIAEGEAERQRKVKEMEAVGAGGTVGWDGERGKEVMQEWKKGMELLEGLKETLPATTHKLTKAKDALDFLGSKDKGK